MCVDVCGRRGGGRCKDFTTKDYCLTRSICSQAKHPAKDVPSSPAGLKKQNRVLSLDCIGNHAVHVHVRYPAGLGVTMATTGQATQLWKGSTVYTLGDRWVDNLRKVAGVSKDMQKYAEVEKNIQE